MWLIIQTICENVSHVVNFSLAMHNSGATQAMHDFQNAWPTPEKRSLRDLFRGEDK